MKKRPQSFLQGSHHPSSLDTSSAVKQSSRASSVFESSNPLHFNPRRSSIVYSKNPKAQSQDPRPVNDRNFQLSAVRTVNAYFQSHGFAFTIPLKGFPSGKDVRDMIHFLFRQLDPELSLGKLEDDVPFYFKHFGYPFSINKSSLYAAGSPHSWPPLLAGLAWIVQLLNYKEKLEAENPNPNLSSEDQTLAYVAESYGYYLRGDDVAAEGLDREIMLQMEEERAVIAHNLGEVETLVREMEAKVQGSKSGSDVLAGLESEKGLLAKDVVKFHSIIGNFRAKKGALEKGMLEKEEELEAKKREFERVSGEIEGLKEQVERQHVNVRDYEKMSREVQCVDGDIRAADEARRQWDEKAWEMEVAASKKLKELEGLVDRYNQEVTRLKLGTAFEYKLNSRGKSATEILGVDFKSTIKLGIISSTEGYEKGSREKWEESIAVQQLLRDKVSEQEGKRNTNMTLVTKIKKLEVRYNAIKKSMEDYVAYKVEECSRLTREIENNEHNMKLQAIEADEYLKKATSELESVTKHYDDEIKLCCNELFSFIDKTAKHKEHVESTVLLVKTSIKETVEEVKNTYSRNGEVNGKTND